eukprot:429251_1
MKPCRYYARPGGCWHSSQCWYSHEIAECSALGSLQSQIKQIADILQQLLTTQHAQRIPMESIHELQHQSPHQSPRMKKARSKRSRSRSPRSIENETKEMDIHPSNLTASALILGGQSTSESTAMDGNTAAAASGVSKVHCECKETQGTALSAVQSPVASQRIGPRQTPQKKNPKQPKKNPPNYLPPRHPKHPPHDKKKQKKKKLNPYAQVFGKGDLYDTGHKDAKCKDKDTKCKDTTPKHSAIEPRTKAHCKAPKTKQKEVFLGGLRGAFVGNRKQHNRKKKKENDELFNKSSNS